MSRTDARVAAGLFGVVAVAFLVTLCPSVYVEGSGELIGATWWLGTPHPTGYPLYALLGRCLAWLAPVASPARAVNVATALMGAAAAVALYLLLRRQRCVPAAAAAAALVLAGGRTFWSQAVIAEVYTLFVLAAIVVLAVAASPGVPDGRRRLLAGYVAGVAATCHLQAVLLLPAALAPLVWPRRDLRGWLGDVVRVGLGVGLGASLILYLVVRNGVGPGFHWGDLDGTRALWAHVSAALYRPAFVWLPAPALALAAARFGAQLAGEWAPPLLLLIGLGAVVAWRRARRLALVLLAATLLNLGAALVYHRDPAGLDVFFLLAILCACVVAGFGFDALWRLLRLRLGGRPASLLVLATAVGGVVGNAAVADRADATLPDRFARAILAGLAPDAVLLTDGDDASYSVDYLHRIEGLRPDVQIYNRLGRGTDLAAGVPQAQRRRQRRRREVELLRSQRPVYYLVARLPPAHGVRFVPTGLVYRAVVGRASVPVGESPLDLLRPGDEAVGDPWVRKLAADVWFMEAERRRELGRGDADQAYLHAADIVPSSRTTNYNVAVKLLQLKELEAASRCALRAVAADPVRLGPYPLAVAILRRLGRNEAAEMVHKEAQEWARIP